MKNSLIFLFILFCSAIQAQTRDTSKVDTRPMCTAKTKAGTQCKHHAVAPATFCNVHNPLTPRCGQPTKAAAPCRRTVKQPGQHCAVHPTSNTGQQ